MAENLYIKEFRDAELKQATAKFWEATGKAVEKNINIIAEQVKSTFTGLFNTIADIQENNDIGRITISLLRITAFEDNQLAKIEVYDKDEITGKLIYDTYMDISFIFSEWENYKLSLATLAEKKGVRLYINDTCIRFLMEEKLTDMTAYLYSLLKYMLIDADEYEGYNLMNTIPGFMITVGEYMDWQNVLYAQIPAQNLENIDKDMPTMFMRIENENYYGLNISNVDFRKSKFINCKFNNCVFENVNLNDTLFKKCQFRNVEMKSGTMYGAVLKSCVRINTDFSGMDMRWEPFKNSDSEYEIYQNTIWTDESKIQNQSEQE